MTLLPIGQSNSGQKAKNALVTLHKSQPLEAQGRMGEERRMDMNEENIQHSYIMLCIS